MIDLFGIILIVGLLVFTLLLFTTLWLLIKYPKYVSCLIRKMIKKVKALPPFPETILPTVSDTIWILYRIENGEIKTFGHFNDYNRANRWADAGGYKILEIQYL